MFPNASFVAHKIIVGYFVAALMPRSQHLVRCGKVAGLYPRGASMRVLRLNLDLPVLDEYSLSAVSLVLPLLVASTLLMSQAIN
jgi:hypothetical protein